MKILVAVILLSLLFFQGFSQRNPDIKVGLGMPFLLGNTTGTEANKVSGFPNICLEKPIPILIDRDEKISFTPGASFFYFKEKEESGVASAGHSSKLNHTSLNVYSKLFYNLMIQRRSEAFIYFGGIFGGHIVTQSKGIKTINSTSIENEGFTENINPSGRDFFNIVYYGAIIGFQPDMKITNKYGPSFELSYYPNFATRLNNEKANIIQLTILLGINK